MHDLSQSSDARSFPVSRFCGRTGSKVLGLVKSRAGDENTEPRAVAREITICRWEPHPADRLSKGGSERFLHYVPLCIFLKLTDIRSHLCSSLGLPCRERAGLPQLGLAARCHFGSSSPAWCMCGPPRGVSAALGWLHTRLAQLHGRQHWRLGCFLFVASPSCSCSALASWARRAGFVSALVAAPPCCSQRLRWLW